MKTHWSGRRLLVRYGGSVFSMGELVQVSADREVAPEARTGGWPNPHRLILAGVASILALWIVVSPNVYAAVACLLLTLVYATRVWPKVCRLVVFAVIPNNLIWASFVFLRGFGDSSPL